MDVARALLDCVVHQRGDELYDWRLLAGALQLIEVDVRRLGRLSLELGEHLFVRLRAGTVMLLNRFLDRPRGREYDPDVASGEEFHLVQSGKVRGIRGRQRQ